jgi:toxin FitB
LSLLKYCASKRMQNENLKSISTTLKLEQSALHQWQLQDAKNRFSALVEPVAAGTAQGLLLSTAQCHSLTLVTREVTCFAPCQKLFNPWGLT